MTTDTQESLITYLYNRLTSEVTLKTAMGGTVRCYMVWAKTDAAMPYLVHRLDMRPEGNGIWPERLATYTLDIWSYSAIATEIIAIRKRIVELLDQLLFNTTSNDVTNCYIELLSDGFIPSGEPEIFHYSMVFNIHLWRQAETVYIIGR
jgi:hypothetical protein